MYYIPSMNKNKDYFEILYSLSISYIHMLSSDFQQSLDPNLKPIVTEEVMHNESLCLDIFFMNNIGADIFFEYLYIKLKPKEISY